MCLPDKRVRSIVIVYCFIDMMINAFRFYDMIDLPLAPFIVMGSKSFSKNGAKMYVMAFIFAYGFGFLGASMKRRTLLIPVMICDFFQGIVPLISIFKSVPCDAGSCFLPASISLYFTTLEYILYKQIRDNMYSNGGVVLVLPGCVPTAPSAVEVSQERQNFIEGVGSVPQEYRVQDPYAKVYSHQSSAASAPFAYPSSQIPCCENVQSQSGTLPFPHGAPPPYPQVMTDNPPPYTP